MSRTDEEQEASKLAALLQADGLPGVFVSTLRPWRDIADEALAHLTRSTSAQVFVRQGELVRIRRKEDGTPYIAPMNDAALKHLLATSMNFVRIGMKGPQHIPPPDDIVQDILRGREQWPFPPLDALVEFPVFRPDGTLLDQPGYDQATMLAYVPVPGLVIPPIPAQPTEEQLVDAITLIDEAIREFPFQDEASSTNALALLLTPLIRQAINGHVPLALVDATRPGTGKSLLAEIVALVATGRKAAMMGAPYDDDEWRKRISATLSDGATIIVIDNVRARLQSAALDLALTSHTVQERILGQSRNGVYAQRATWIATGNNIQLGGDMPRRCYWIRMDAHTDKPWRRGGFTHNLEEWVPANRGALIAALLTLARAWFVAGKPAPAQPLPRIGGFQPWVETIGGILAHAGISGFLGNTEELYEQADNDALQWAAFLHAWQDAYGEREVLTSEILRDIKAGTEVNAGSTTTDLYNALPDDLADLHKGDFRRRLGKALAAAVGSQFDESGLHIERGHKDSRSGAMYWKVAGLQVSQIAMPQKAELLKTNDPPGGLQGDTSAIFEEKFLPEVEENKPAKPANLQKEEGPTGDALPLEIGQRVSTPEGVGIVVQRWPHLIGVKVDGVQEVAYFRGPVEIACILPLTATTQPIEQEEPP
jgi:hypothetical protein